MHEALYYRVKDDVVICELCPHMCRLNDGDVGRCQTRVNSDGKLYSLAYANLCAVHVDPVEKKPLYHFLPASQTLSIATSGCNLKCLNCQNSSISQIAPKRSEEHRLMPDELVHMALQQGCTSISYTYTDPTVYYEYMLETAQLAHKQGLKNIMVSAGYINPAPLSELIGFIDAVNIDLKCFDNEVYKELCGITLKPVLNTLIALKKAGVWLEITNLVVPEYSDDMQMIDRMLDWLIANGFEDVPIHFNRFLPAYRLMHVPATSPELLQNIAELARVKGMRYVYVGNIGTNAYRHTYCFSCGQVLIKRIGYQVEKHKFSEGRCAVCGSFLPGFWLK
ncbi:AmmeMemoRadiSam system radical SAM enzyme [Carboxylicivirga taeanensis]|uniref:AmmeMemoRadiSam system radical SAM enzyme n=1 Tax=Carboxylicivirga taeanensis TaxID=1416875 RepID=UPI003F6DD509